MAKIALLIGISDYGEALTSLPGTQEDLQAMQRVLKSPDVGAFDRVEVLPNPNRTAMEVAIETLFTDNRDRDDLILLYFSGHGVRDDSGVLYFAASNTQKSLQGRILTSTAVSSGALQGYMGQSRSKRQVLILDCCFSGAFARDMKAKDDEAVNVKAQLGGEGRAVLTSSTATQVSYEREGASLYTTYLVQGLETGAADKDGNGQITVDELHEYAREKVQEQAPTMQPEIYAVKEGYKIFIARAPQGDPKLAFRKEVDERAKLKRGQFSPIDRRAFKFRAQELRLPAPEAKHIIDEVLQPYQAFWAKLNEFEAAVKDTLEYDPQMSIGSINDLRYFQRILKLRDEDIAPVLNTYQIDLVAQTIKSVTASNSFKAASVKTASADISDELSLESEQGVDYAHLRELLRAGKWKEADQETVEVMLKAAGKDAEERRYLTLDEARNFPCKDLLTIDRLWVHFSGGKFGFSVQKQIWVEVGGKLDFGEDRDAAIAAYDKMSDRNGWRVNESYISYDQVTFNTSAPAGHLPLGWGEWGEGSCVWGLVFCGGFGGWGSLLSHPDL
ncbi:GUN4 domain-containing protein [Halomicronema sp. CCY15110]|uniref:caspase, EACC1-associated type n=1 Tax=Halomicronema sp. CCY15110 TaxID=2767773 RepID=UPI00194F8C94|nr:GUN4 domain-containing protein [Halomicronema sp. CCY15110]